VSGAGVGGQGNSVGGTPSPGGDGLVVISAGTYVIYNYEYVHHEILNLPNEFKTLIGERGTTLSGGQKQRVAIARAIIKKPEIFIFDDCLSAVDAKTEQTILKNFSDYIEDKTAIMITHRIFYGFHFDLIIYIEDGKIAEMGTHESLLVKNGLYAELYQAQQTHDKA
jgi:ATP-binding cassette subfamily B protein